MKDTHPSTTQPAADDVSVSVLAVPGHDFFTTFTQGTRTIELSGSVEERPNGEFHVLIRVDDPTNGVEGAVTKVDLKPGKAIELSGAANGWSGRTAVLTVKTTNADPPHGPASRPTSRPGDNGKGHTSKLAG